MSSPKYLDKIINSSLQKIKKEFEYDNNSMIKDFKRHDSIENLRTQMVSKIYNTYKLKNIYNNYNKQLC